MIRVQEESGTVELTYRLGDKVLHLGKVPSSKFSYEPYCWLAELMKATEFALITKTRLELDPSDQLCEDTGFCGCGEPEKVYKWLETVLSELGSEPTPDKGRRVLRAMGFDVGKVSEVPPAAWLIFYWLGDRDWIEHGSLCLYSWLTSEGEAILDRLRRGEYIEVSRDQLRVEKVEG